ncbi:permease [Pseudomonas paraeruginosa]|nr:permease [Pseudomonas aeruginosa]
MPTDLLEQYAGPDNPFAIPGCRCHRRAVVYSRWKPSYLWQRL